MSIDDQGGPGRLQPDHPQMEAEAPAREPAFSAPWQALVLAGSFLVLYGLQTLVDSNALIDRFGFSSVDLAEGRAGGLVTALFIHGSWAHAFFNALWGLAFGVPI